MDIKGKYICLETFTINSKYTVTKNDMINIIKCGEQPFSSHLIYTIKGYPDYPHFFLTKNIINRYFKLFSEVRNNKIKNILK